MYVCVCCEYFVCCPGLFYLVPQTDYARIKQCICKVFGYNFKMQNTWTSLSISQKRFSTYLRFVPVRTIVSKTFWGSERFMVQVLLVYSSEIRGTHYYIHRVATERDSKPYFHFVWRKWWKYGGKIWCFLFTWSWSCTEAKTNAFHRHEASESA